MAEIVKHKEWGKKDAEGNEIPHALGKDCWCNPEVRKI